MDYSALASSVTSLFLYSMALRLSSLLTVASFATFLSHRHQRVILRLSDLQARACRLQLATVAGRIEQANAQAIQSNFTSLCSSLLQLASAGDSRVLLPDSGRGLSSMVTGFPILNFNSSWKTLLT